MTPGPLTLTFEGLEFDARTPKGAVHVKSRLVGRPNVSNILATVATATALDLPAAAIERGLASLGGVPGRFELVSSSERRHHRRDRLRAHRRRAEEPARDGAAAGAAPCHHRVRLRRRSRSHEAAADGRGRGQVERRRRDDLRQPAQRGSGAHHRRDQARGSAGVRSQRRDVCDCRSQGSDSVRDQESGAGRSRAARGQGARAIADDRQPRSCRSTKQRSRARRWSGDADACRRRRCHRRGSVGAGRRSGDIGFFDRHADDCRRATCSWRFAAIDSTATRMSPTPSARAPLAAMVSDAALTGAPELAGTPLVVVPDTIAALQTLANRVRRDSGAAVVAVTGSAGKSTTKEITAEFLAARYTVFRNRGNLNNHIGLPLSLLELRKKPDIGVLELGMNHFGEISALVKIAEPEVRVWTNVGPAHLEFFGTVDAIAEAKAEILEGADKDSLLVANADDDLVMRHAGTFAGRVRTFGVERPADVRALAVRDLGIDGTAAHRADADWRSGDSDAAARNRQSVERARRGGGRHPLRCAACRHRRACSRTEAGRPARRSDSRRRRDHRRRLVQLESEGPVARARDARRRDALRAPGRRRRRNARAGRGIGRTASRGRRRSRACRTSGELVAVGGANARALADGAVRARACPRRGCTTSRTARPRRDLAATLVRPGDLVLVKGSRGIRTEVVVDRLKAEFA